MDEIDGIGEIEAIIIALSKNHFFKISAFGVFKKMI